MLDRFRRWLTRRFFSHPPPGAQPPRYDAQSTTITGPFVGRGSCLAPWVSGGDLIWTDSGLVPNDGDLVDALMWCQNDFSGVRRFSGAPRPTAERRPVVKLYRRTAAGEFLVCADGWYRLGGEHRVTGVVVGLLRCDDRHKLADMDFPDRVIRRRAG